MQWTTGLARARAFACLDTSDTLPCIHRLEEVPLEVLRQRESKWLDMLNNWDKWMAKKHKKVRGLGLGVSSLRGREGKGNELHHCSKMGLLQLPDCLRCPPLVRWGINLALGLRQS